jgi:Domain of Unknown Function (DUF928)
MTRSLLWLLSLLLFISTPSLLAEMPLAIAQSAFKVPKPPNRGAPGTPAAGASRTDVELTALVPITPTAVGGYTTLEQPTFWFYNPYVTVPAKPLQQSKLVGLKLIIKDAEDKPVDSVVVPLPSQAGLLSVSLTQKLLPDRPYRWSLQARIQKPSATVPEIVIVSGWIQREIPCPTLSQALKTAKAEERYRLYQQAGIWYDALTSLAELRSTQPKNQTWQQEWGKLLKDANVPQPVINCSLGSCKLLNPSPLRG